MSFIQSLIYVSAMTGQFICFVLGLFMLCFPFVIIADMMNGKFAPKRPALVWLAFTAAWTVGILLMSLSHWLYYRF